MDNNLKIREIRESRGMTQRRLAEEMNLTPGSVAKWELGYTVPTMQNLNALANVLRCSVDELLGRTSA